MSLVIKGGTAFVDGRFDKKDILIEGGIIAGVGSDLKGDEAINANGLLVLPGLIDPHVHLREPGDTTKEDFLTGGRAAIAGGFTTVMDMPNNAVPTTTKERLDEKIGLAKKALCDVLFHFGGTDDNFDEVKKANPSSLKLYLSKTTGELMLRDPASVEKHFRNFPSERPIVLHCSGDAEEQEANLRQTYEKTETAVSLAMKSRRRIHMAHVSTKDEIDIVKKYGGCTFEVAPHHILLSDNDIERLGHLAKVYPPLRPEGKRIELLSTLQLADCIATDHAPHTLEDKEKGAAGFPGLETSLALMLGLCEHAPISKEWVVRKMSEDVARIFNIQKKGKLAKGHAGDVTLVDEKKEWKVAGAEMETKCKWSPFEGKLLKGKVHTVVKDGKPVYAEYEFV
jgi:dihydroorotase